MAPTQIGAYRLLRELSRGSMGAIYEAVHVTTGARHALKFLLDERLASTDPEALARFRREAETLGRLKHPRVVSIHAADFEGSVPYIVQDLLTGGSLAERLRGGPLSFSEAVGLALGLAEGLQAAHDQGILHRDLKPANVVFDEHGGPCLVDFGLARDLVSAEHLTQTGTVMGTPTYMAPEQAHGQRGDVRTDVYGLGGILYASLTGRPPISAQGGLLLTLAVVANGEITRPRELRADLPERLEAVCLKALATDPAERYPSVRGFADALGSLEEPPRKLPIPALLGIAAAVVLSVGLLATAIWSPSDPHPGPTDPAPPAQPDVADDPAEQLLDRASQALAQGDSVGALEAAAQAEQRGLGGARRRHLRGLAHLLAGDPKTAMGLLTGASLKACAVEEKRERLFADLHQPAPFGDTAYYPARTHELESLIRSARSLATIELIGPQLTARTQETIARCLLVLGEDHSSLSPTEIDALFGGALALSTSGHGAGALRTAWACYRYLHTFERPSTRSNVLTWTQLALDTKGLAPRWRSMAWLTRSRYMPEVASLLPDRIPEVYLDLEKLERKVAHNAYYKLSRSWGHKLTRALNEGRAGLAAEAYRASLELCLRASKAAHPRVVEHRRLDLAQLYLLALQWKEAKDQLGDEMRNGERRSEAELMRLEIDLRLIDPASLDPSRFDKLVNSSPNDPRPLCLRAAFHFAIEDPRARDDLSAAETLSSPALGKHAWPEVQWRTPDETRREAKRETGRREFLRQALATHPE